MSKRERVLIVLLAALIILLGGFKLVVEPALKSLSAANQELEDAQNALQQAEINERQAKRIEEDIVELSDQIADKSQQFLPELQNDKIQIFFEELAGKAGIAFDFFQMDAITTSIVEGFSPLNSDISYPAKDNASAIRSMNEQEKGQSTTTTTAGQQGTDKQNKGLVEKMDVSMKFAGSYEQMRSFLDAVKESGRTVRVTSVSTTAIEEELLMVEVRAECFGIKKLTDTDPLTQKTLPGQPGKPNPYY